MQFRLPPWSNYQPTKNTTMGHLQTLETELRALRDSLRFEMSDEEDFGTLVNWVKDQVLTSYRNGLAARDAKKDVAPEHTARPPRSRKS